MKFTSEGISYLIKGFKLSCYKIHKNIIRKVDLILQFRKYGESLIKPYITYTNYIFRKYQ